MAMAFLLTMAVDLSMARWDIRASASSPIFVKAFGESAPLERSMDGSCAMLEEAFPGYEAPTTAKEMAQYIMDFSLTGNKMYNGKILQVSSSTP